MWADRPGSQARRGAGCGSAEDGADLLHGSEDAIRHGLEQAIDEEEDAGRLNTVAAWVLSQAAQNAPVEWVVRAVEEIGPILG